MQTLKLSDYGLVHAGPTCGKSTMVANVIKDNPRSILDTDPIVFGLMMPNDLKQVIEQNLPARPWISRGKDRLQWKVVERGVLLVTNCLFELYGTEPTIVTNMLLEKQALQNWRSITFFRNPESMAKIMEVRDAARGKSKKIDDLLKVTTGWYEGWKKHAGDYDEAVELKDGEFLATVFNIDCPITDVNEVDRLVHGTMYTTFKDLNILDMIAPSDKVNVGDLTNAKN